MICRSIREAVLSGRYNSGERLPSESELISLFGASRITVNRALRELQLCGIIDRRAGSGSYVRAQTGRSYTFGLLIPELGQTEIFEPICRGMALAEDADHHHSLLWSKSLGDSGTKASQPTELCRRLVSERVAGAFFAPLELTPEKDTVNQMIVETFDKAGIPIVLLDRDLVAYPARSRYDLVGIDNRRAGYAITRHLLEAGCRRTVFVGRPGSAPTVEARIAGYREAILDSNLEWDPLLAQRIAPWDEDAVKQLLCAVKPDGIVCANDFTAAHLMKTLAKLGVGVPDEIRLAGIDDVKYAGLLPVPLTTVHQPCETIGAVAVAAMVQRICNPDLPTTDIFVDFHLVIRESTRGPADVAGRQA